MDYLDVWCQVKPKPSKISGAVRQRKQAGFPRPGDCVRPSRVPFGDSRGVSHRHTRRVVPPGNAVGAALEQVKQAEPVNGIPSLRLGTREIARALLRNPAVLVLDEATNARSCSNRKIKSRIIPDFFREVGNLVVHQ